MKRFSFRLRIALLSMLISGLVLVGFGGGAYYVLYQQKLESVDTEIRALGNRHPGWLANRANFDRYYTSLLSVFGEEHRDGIIFLVKDGQGQTLYTSPNWPKELPAEQLDCTLADDPAAYTQTTNAVSPPETGGPGRGRGGMGRGAGLGGGGPVVFTKLPRFFTARTTQGAWRIGVLGNDELRLAIGQSYELVQAELVRVRTIFLITVPLALALIGAGGWVVAGRALRPLNRIARTAEQVTARGLNQRISASEDAPEISRLIQVLNGMMDRLETSFHQATRFSADASHELKTPLAVMQGELEQAIQSAAPGSAEQRFFGRLLDETQHLKRITSNLLLLAQADAGRLKLALETVPLSEELAGMAEDAQILAAETQLQFELKLQPGVRVIADRGLLRMALLNLIQNAVRYNEPGGSVGLSLVGGPETELTICNTGPGIPAPDQPHIFERFYRVRQSRSLPGEGMGLGLSLAREIILAHNGVLQLQESRPGHTCFTVVLKPDPVAQSISFSTGRG
jgi:two-component system, OmpR family, heavy metal sensor histidine kinase CusS